MKKEKIKIFNLSCTVLQNQFNPLQSVNGVCVSKSFPIHPGKNYCALFSSSCVPARPESLGRIVCVRLSAKWCTEVGLFPHAWVYKSSTNMRTGNICLHMDGSATAETTCNYTGLKDLEEGYQILKDTRGCEGFSNMKCNQQRQSEKAQHMC